MLKIWLLFQIITSLVMPASGQEKKINFQYKGQAYSTQNKNIPPHSIPGKIQCEYYDLGGEGVAFHDKDSINNGSGRLNKGSDYLSVFRINEAVDISFTKFHDAIDHSEFNLVQPQEGQLYVGWTEPGEWINLTVLVEKTAVYTIGFMYTCNGDGEISFDVNSQDKTGAISVPSTHNSADPMAWRQWHHWNYKDGMAAITLQKGRQVLTLHIVKNGQMNFDYITFTKKQ